MKVKLLALVVLAMSAVAGLAQGEDPYIESTGVAGINTGYRMKPNSKIEVDFQLTDTMQIKGGRLFGADFNHVTLKTAIGFFTDDNSQEEGTLCWTFGYGDSVSGWHGNGWVKDSKGYYLKLDTLRHIVDYDIPAGKHCYYTDGVAIAWRTDTPANYTEEATAPVTIFSAKSNTLVGDERPIKARIFGVKFYEKIEGEYVLVRDFRPCVSTGRRGMKAGVAVPGFKCAVTGGFIGSPDNYSSFAASENTPSETVNEAGGYVSTGAAADKEYIDTGYIPTDKTRCEIDYSLNSVPSGSGWLFSATGENSKHFYGVYLRGGYPNTYYMHNGTGWHKEVVCENALALDTPRTVILDYPSNEFCVVGGMVTNTLYKQSAYAVKDKVYVGSIRLACKYDSNGEFASIKIHGFRIFEDGVKKHDYKPMKFDGVWGLMDSVEGTFISCAKPLGIIDGGDAEVVTSPYVETLTSACQYINTEHIPTVNTRIEVDYALASDYTSGTWNIFRGKMDSSNYFTCYHNSSGFGAKNANGWPGAEKAFANVARICRRAVLDNYCDIGALVTAGVTNYIVSTVNPTSLSGAGAAIWLSSTQAGGEYGSLRIYSCRIFEANELEHEFLPALMDDGRVGLLDTKTSKFHPVLSKSNSNPQVAAGFVPEVASATSTRLNYGDTATLTATAPGAVSYRWFRNGTQIAGGENGTLTVDWRKGPSSDVYTAKGVYEIDGVAALSGASAGIVIENIPAGFILRIK